MDILTRTITTTQILGTISFLNIGEITLTQARTRLSELGLSDTTITTIIRGGFDTLTGDLTWPQFESLVMNLL